MATKGEGKWSLAATGRQDAGFIKRKHHQPVPPESGTGKAKVTLSFPDCKEMDIAPAVVEVDIVEAKTSDKK